MHAWLAETQRLLARGEPAVLVTVAKVEGSAPREAGAKLLVTRENQWQTIGGGHLEWRAIDIARQMLKQGVAHGARRIERLALGPSLGQCCGGAVTLAFELFTVADLGWVTQLSRRLQAHQPTLRSVAFFSATPTGPADSGGPVVLTDPGNADTPVLGAPEGGCALWQAQNGARWLTEIIAPVNFHVVLFGAGHVGQALVQILGSLPCTVTWVDEREAQFPASVPANVSVEVTDTPEAAVAEAPPQTYFLVMTHVHALDQRLCEQIFRRDDFAYFGLIGSITKRRQFEHRLRDRGVPPERLEQMVCPIGVAGITGKAPEVIAVATAAQLLRIYEQHGAHLPAEHHRSAPHGLTGSVLAIQA